MMMIALASSSSSEVALDREGSIGGGEGKQVSGVSMEGGMRKR